VNALPDGIKITSLRGTRPPLVLFPDRNPHTYLPKGAAAKVLRSTPKLYNIYTYVSHRRRPVTVRLTDCAASEPSAVVCRLNVFRSTIRSGPKVLLYFFSVCAAPSPFNSTRTSTPATISTEPYNTLVWTDAPLLAFA